jgi:hypothetical protein
VKKLVLGTGVVVVGLLLWRRAGAGRHGQELWADATGKVH